MADFLECTQILIGLKEPAQELWRAYLERYVNFFLLF